MREKMDVNGEILRWARERAGISIENVARKLQKKASDIENWESGEACPTYKQLEKVASTYYKRPIALFFFPKPPEEEDIGQSFRTLPDSEIESIPPRIRYLSRKAKVFQLNVAELLDGVNSAKRMVTRDLKSLTTKNAKTLAKKVREYFKISIEHQKSWGTTDEALKNWRSIIENHGTLVFKESFKNKGRNEPDSLYSGFCLYDKNFPVIYINNNVSKTRQIFTLFHELAHLLSSVGGVDKGGGDYYIRRLSGDNKRIEILCNQFASEFLIPSEDINPLLIITEPTDENISKISNQYYVSREVILRRMLDLEIVKQDFYNKRVARWDKDRRQQERERKVVRGGDYYNTQAAYLSPNYTECVFTKYYQNKITLDQVAGYLGQKVRAIDHFEMNVLKEPI